MTSSMQKALGPAGNDSADNGNLKVPGSQFNRQKVGQRRIANRRLRQSSADSGKGGDGESPATARDRKESGVGQSGDNQNLDGSLDKTDSLDRMEMEDAEELMADSPGVNSYRRQN